MIFFDSVPYIEYSPYQICLLFVIWSFLGWIVDVVGTALDRGTYSSRGFLSGPLCPIYGAGAFLVTTIFRPFYNDILTLFFISAAVCTLLELIVGLLLDALFHEKWWDYSHIPMNYKGLICPRCSFFWGIACLFTIYFLVPCSEYIIGSIPAAVGTALIIVIYSVFALDTVNAVAAAVGHPFIKGFLPRMMSGIYNVTDHSGRLMMDVIFSALEYQKRLIRRVIRLVPTGWYRNK